MDAAARPAAGLLALFLGCAWHIGGAANERDTP
jgi:hypothetical protein